MNNYKIILKKSSDFLNLYLKEYLIVLKTPFLVGLVGFLSMILCVLGPIGAVLALFISIPCICYSFWQGYLITYSLNYAADSFIKTDNKVSLMDCHDLAKKDGNELAKYLVFSSVLCLLVNLFSILYLLSNIASITSITPHEIFRYTFFLTLNSILLLPFSNFLNQAFFYRKKESFFELFLNCYKKLDKTAILLIITFSLIMVLNSINSLIYTIVALVLNPLIYCANTIWYKQKACED